MNLAVLKEAKTPIERRNAIVALQSAMAAVTTHAHESPPLREHFAPGLYAREIFMRAGLCVIGKIHRHAHMNTVSKGKCVVYTEDGEKFLEAGDTWVSEPGTKRIVLCLEDVLWTTTHANPTNSRDSVWLESQLIAPSFEALEYSEPLKVAA